MPPKIEIPPQLLEAVQNRRAIPFLGAGASKEARNSAGNSPPDANQLRDILASKFFQREMKNRDVMAVAEMAITIAGGRPAVFEAVRDAFDGFKPSAAHETLSTFNWRMLATTNYDLLIERGYDASKKRTQNLVRFVKDDERIEEKIQNTLHPLPYLKLHGCLEHIYDNDIPLILSREQYSTYSENRTRLFGRLKYFASESTLIFIGYRLDDPHIRELIYQLEGNRRPRWFIVTPDAESFDVDFWVTKNVGVLKCRFGEFISELDRVILPLWRSLSPSPLVTDFPLRKFYNVTAVESTLLRETFDTDLTLVQAGMPVAAQSAKQFYEGYDTGWGAIVQRFDVRRKVEEELLFKAMLEYEAPTGPVFLLLRGVAGSGKTIALKRTAFEAATSGGLILWLNETGALRPDVISELYELTGKTIYLFVDQVAIQVEKLHPLLRHARSKSIPLVVIGAEREGDWQTYCHVLENEFAPQFFRVGNLSKNEVESLLDLLERHDCLGLLRLKSRDEQIAAFMEEDRADRQLLVALHELTQGKPFEQIVLEEHERIAPAQARQLYLDIATMHQFSVSVRAGIISRISGISFEEFKENFFAPLKDIVKIDTDIYPPFDYCYKTRHSRVASLVFRQVCSDDFAKAKQFKRIVEALDVAYSSDARALQEITRGRALSEAFSNADEVREIYEVAIQAAPRQSFLYQQWAIFESNHKDGSLLEAERLAALAASEDPASKSILHTQAEIDRRRANTEESALLKDSLRMRARKRLNEMPTGDRFAASSRCKILVDELAEMNDSLTDDSKSHELLQFDEKVKDTEILLRRAQQQHPDDADILQVEARFRRVLDDDDKALRALERAWAAVPRGSGTAVRIAKLYDARDRPEDALKVLKEALTRAPEDKPANQALAHHYLQQEQYDPDIVEQYFRKSFSREDQNFEDRYMLAQFLFLRGDIQGAITLFDVINSKAPVNFRRSAPRSENIITRRLGRYEGTVESIKERFLFIRSSHYPRSIYAPRYFSEADAVDELSLGQVVNFRLRFNREGPTAIDIRPGQR